MTTASIPTYKTLSAPTEGETISLRDGRLVVPDTPIIPFIEGDGTGPDIWRASRIVFDAAVERAYGGRRRIVWFEVFAGEKAKQRMDSWLPEDTLAAISHHLVAIKGPLTTPVGGGFRSLNVALRQQLDLYACVRPVRYFEGVPSPVKRPEDVNMLIFRENTEDIYAGIEYKARSPEARALVDFLRREQCIIEGIVGRLVHRTVEIIVPALAVTGGEKCNIHIDGIGIDDRRDGIVKIQMFTVSQLPNRLRQFVGCQRAGCHNTETVRWDLGNLLMQDTNVRMPFQRLSNLE